MTPTPKFEFKLGHVFQKVEFKVSSKLLFILDKNISRKSNEDVLKYWFFKNAEKETPNQTIELISYKNKKLKFSNKIFD